MTLMLTDFAPPTSPMFRGASVSMPRPAGFYPMAPAKNQMACGSCWLFSGMAAVDWLDGKVGDFNSTLSEQQVLDCSYKAPGGCNGGSPTDVFNYLPKVGRHNLREGVPLRGQDPELLLRQQDLDDCRRPTVRLLACAEALARPRGRAAVVSFCTAIHRDFFSYHSGILTECGDSSGGGHCLALTGYSLGRTAMEGFGLECANDGDCILARTSAANVSACADECSGTMACAGWSYVLDHRFYIYEAENGVIGFPADYYLVRNSWGESYGEHGYLRIMNGNVCDMESGEKGTDNNSWLASKAAMRLVEED